MPRMARPPRTPPTIAPTGVLDHEFEEPGGFEEDVDVAGAMEDDVDTGVEEGRNLLSPKICFLSVQ